MYDYFSMFQHNKFPFLLSGQSPDANQPPKCSITSHQNYSKRNHMEPDMGKKCPPEISGINPFAFSLYLCNQCKDLLSFYRAFHLRLGIANQIIPICHYFFDAMHHILTIFPLIKDDISFSDRSVRLPKANSVPLLFQKRFHAAACNRHGHFPPFFG